MRAGIGLLSPLIVVLAVATLGTAQEATSPDPISESPIVAEDLSPPLSGDNWLDVVNVPRQHPLGPEYAWHGAQWWPTTQAAFQRWSASLDMIVLTRTNSNDVSLLRDLATGHELLNADDMSFRSEIGPRFRFLAPLRGCTSLEFSIFGIDGYRAQSTFAGPVELRVPGVTDFGDFATVTSPLLDYRSRLGSQELNLRQTINQRVTLSAGFRSWQLDESLSAASFHTLLYQVHTDNRLYGGQIGLDFRLAARRRYELTAFGRAGLYRNDALSETSDSSGLFAVTPENRSLRANAGATSFAGEAGLIGSLRLWDFVMLRGGYQVMHLEAVAIAPEQLPLNDFALPANPTQSASGINDSGQVFYHGAVAGLEVRW